MSEEQRYLHDLFSEDVLTTLFPPERTDLFFDALFGDSTAGDYDIRLSFKEETEDSLEFEFHLRQRPGKCLACHLTHGLPKVFSRHPMINVEDIVMKIQQLLDKPWRYTEWKVGKTREISRKLHVIPLSIYVDKTHLSPDAGHLDSD